MSIVNSDIALSFFLQLLLGHVVGDFLLQPYWLVLAKRRGWPGLLLHVWVVTFTTAILIWNSIPNWWVWVIVLFVGHLFIDQFRTFVFIDNSKGKGLLLLILDQVAHVMLIWLIAWAATGWTWASLATLPSLNAPNQFHLMAYLIGLATLISTAPVLEAEVTVAVWAAQGQEINHTLGIDTSDRVLGGLERILAMAFILSGFGLLAPLVFLPRLGLMIFQGQARQNRTQVITKVVTSLATAVVVSLILFNVPMPILFV
ncbi:MAG TPA: DUF3307 domain-containing protein [Anaerolineae bacterium]|nr:DUF3307 domain-containing protein [Anaerolineae bacterium]HMR67771.1 DUF3307 domain-containing protein [Anaerolineae bacterium]